MDRSTSVPMGMGEQSLTPGEQRILALMEQGQQRLDQRLHSLEAGQQRTEQRLHSLEAGQQRLEQRLHSLEAGQQRTEQRLHSLEDGQQRLDQRLHSLEAGQQRTEQRLHSLEAGQQRTEQQLKELTLKVDQEAAASKTRDRELAAELVKLREEGQKQQIWLLGKIERSQQEMLEAMHQEMNQFRTALSMRFDRHDTRLRVVEQTLERHEEHLREHGQAIQGLQREVQKLTAAVEHLTQAPRVAASP